MFGPDTPLVMDALQIAGLALIAGAAGTWGVMRYRKTGKPPAPGKSTKYDLEDRVRVLERIATDRSIELADEIESLRAEKETA